MLKRATARNPSTRRSPARVRQLTDGHPSLPRRRCGAVRTGSPPCGSSRWPHKRRAPSRRWAGTGGRGPAAAAKKGPLPTARNFPLSTSEGQSDRNRQQLWRWAAENKEQRRKRYSMRGSWAEAHARTGGGSGHVGAPRNLLLYRVCKASVGLRVPLCRPTRLATGPLSRVFFVVVPPRRAGSPRGHLHRRPTSTCTHPGRQRRRLGPTL